MLCLLAINYNIPSDLIFSRYESTRTRSRTQEWVEKTRKEPNAWKALLGPRNVLSWDGSWLVLQGTGCASGRQREGEREGLGDKMITLCGNEQHRIRWAESLRDFCWGCFAVVIVPMLFSTNVCLIRRDRKKVVPRLIKQDGMEGGSHNSTRS